VVLLAALGGTGDTTTLAQEQEAPQKPNIVFILADDMHVDDFEHMPHTRQLLAEQGTEFSKAFVSFSLCCPSRASILRGQYAHNHQIIGNKAPHGGFEKFQDLGHESSTVATWLRDAGYRTVLLGKYFNSYGQNGSQTYVPPGWDEWYGLKGTYYNYWLNENGTVVSYGTNPEEYQTDVFTRKAIDYVSRAADDEQPFFMYLAPKAPHFPHTPAPRHKNAYAGVKAPRPPSFNEGDIADKPAWVRGFPRLTSTDRQKIDKIYRSRLQMLLSLDEMVAGLIGELKATGELNNTYVFFTSDNGYHLGEHRIDLHKNTPYEEAIRVPLVVRGPGVLAGRTVDEMTLNIDFAPTIAELAGVSAPKFVDGRSLVPLLSATPSATWRSAFLLERGIPTYVGIRTETHKYVEHATGEKELYDLSSDPYELESRHETAAPALVKGLKSRLKVLKACAGEYCWDAEDAP
jgi:arylsulfatase A-like enzyme